MMFIFPATADPKIMISLPEKEDNVNEKHFILTDFSFVQRYIKCRTRCVAFWYWRKFYIGCTSNLSNPGVSILQRRLEWQNNNCWLATSFACMTILETYTLKNALLVNKLCSQQTCNKLVNKFVAMLLFCQVVPSL